MAYASETVARARARLAAMKEDRESLTRQRLAEVYEAQPRIRQIDMELRRTMVQAAQAAFTDGSLDVLEKAKAHNQALQQERAEILNAFFAPGYLDESPVCPKCGGTGYLGSQMCQCLSRLCQEEQRRELTALENSGSFARFRLDYYSDVYDPRMKTSARAVMERTLDFCRQYAMQFGPESGSLLFVGGTGRGKTFLAGCVANAVSDRGWGVVYEPAGTLFTALENAKFNATEETIHQAQKYSACDLLILDDLGTEMPGQFVTAALYSLVNQRLLARKATIITTNLTYEEIEKRYNPQIASRLYGDYRRLTFVGEDIRVLKNRGVL